MSSLSLATATDRVRTTFTIEPENEWDFAAGVLPIEESACVISDADGKLIALARMIHDSSFRTP